MTRPRLLAYGHSWVAGDGASAPQRRLVNVATTLLEMTPVNHGVGGASSQQVAELVRQTGVAPAGAYLLILGLNDARRHGLNRRALSAFTRALATVVDACAQAAPGSPVLLVEQPLLVDYSQHPPHDRGSAVAVDAYNDRVRRVAADQPRAVVVRVTGWDASSMLAHDTVHPNDLGHHTIGVAVADAYAVSEPRTGSDRQVRAAFDAERNQ